MGLNHGPGMLDEQRIVRPATRPCQPPRKTSPAAPAQAATPSSQHAANPASGSPSPSPNPSRSHRNKPRPEHNPPTDPSPDTHPPTNPNRPQSPSTHAQPSSRTHQAVMSSVASERSAPNHPETSAQPRNAARSPHPASRSWLDFFVTVVIVHLGVVPPFGKRPVDRRVRFSGVEVLPE